MAFPDAAYVVPSAAAVGGVIAFYVRRLLNASDHAAAERQANTDKKIDQAATTAARVEDKLGRLTRTVDRNHAQLDKRVALLEIRDTGSSRR